MTPRDDVEDDARDDEGIFPEDDEVDEVDERGLTENVALYLDGITKRFPGVVANDDVDLVVERGSVHALLGENGAGKTTLMSVLYGLYEPDEGRVVVDGVEQAFDSPRDAIDAGIGMIHQHFMLVGPMTAAENIALGTEPRKWFGLTVDRAAIRRDVEHLCDRYGFDVDPDDRIEDLSVGVRQRVEILKALYRGADVLILDEPTAVLTPQEVESLYRVLDELTAQGKTIIFITHKLDEAMHASDAITVLRDGRAVGTVDPDETSRNELAKLMVGREVVFDVEGSATERGESVLAVSELVVEDDRGVETVSGLEFEVHAGEIFGIAGVDGNGQSELIEAITGLRDPEEGTITLASGHETGLSSPAEDETGLSSSAEGEIEKSSPTEDITEWSRQRRIDAGMAYVPEDRQERGLVMSFELLENGVLGSHRSESFANDGRIDWRAVRDHTEEVIDTYDVNPGNPNARAASLSGGNQQKFVVGREFERNPTVLVAANPTRGVDVGSTEFIREQLLALREQGVAILLVSSKLDEIRSLSDRIAVIYEGTFMDVADPDERTEEELGLLMAGQQLEAGRHREESRNQEPDRRQGTAHRGETDSPREDT